jgi:hypothetical protein
MISPFRDEHGWLVVEYCASSVTLPPTTPRPWPERINDPEHWRRRAEEAHTIAEQMIDRDAIATMLHVAEEYEDLAQKAERRGLAKAK